MEISCEIGLRARGTDTPTIPNGYKSLRSQLKADGSLASIPGDSQNLIFTRDVPFNSPSAAASVIYGASMSGPLNWFVAGTNQTYADYRKQALQAAEAQSALPENEVGEC